VLARDCAASIKRWGRRDVFGVEILRISDEISGIDDRTLEFRLKQPFPKLPQALGKPGAYMPAIMPQRLAETDPYKQLTEIICSGPFRYVKEERLQGVRNVYAGSTAMCLGRTVCRIAPPGRRSCTSSR
jgi:peptide/nickel transport system substrate-binding protein